MKKILKGKFYRHNDSKGGHPALVYKKSDKKNKYYIVCFTKSKNKTTKQLTYNINPEIPGKVDGVTNRCCVVKNPKIVRRKVIFDDSSFKKYRVHPVDKPYVKLIVERKKR